MAMVSSWMSCVESNWAVHIEWWQRQLWNVLSIAVAVTNGSTTHSMMTPFTVAVAVAAPPCEHSHYKPWNLFESNVAIAVPQCEWALKVRILTRVDGRYVIETSNYCRLKFQATLAGGVRCQNCTVASEEIRLCSFAVHIREVESRISNSKCCSIRSKRLRILGTENNWKDCHVYV